MIILIQYHQKQNGIITGVDDMGNIQVTWENGSTLSLVVGIDEFKTLDGETQNEKNQDTSSRTEQRTISSKN